MDSPEKKYRAARLEAQQHYNLSEVIGEFVFFNDEKVLGARFNQPRKRIVR